jgi:Rod binding domain-containing protein
MIPDDSRSVPLEQSRRLETEKKRLHKAAREMESVFLYQVLRAMRKSIPESEKGSGAALGGLGKDVYTQMFDQELAMRMAGDGGRSIAEHIYRSLEKVLERQYGINEQNGSGIKDVFPPRKYFKINNGPDSFIGKPAGNKAPGSRSRIPEYEHVIRQVAGKYRLHPSLIHAVIRAESNGDPSAVSRAGAKGLMQLTDSTASDMGVRDVFNPEENIEGGARYLRLLIDRFGDIEKALAAYNAGPDTVRRFDDIPPYPETRDYVRRVLKQASGKQLYY